MLTVALEHSECVAGLLHMGASTTILNNNNQAPIASPTSDSHIINASQINNNQVEVICEEGVTMANPADMHDVNVVDTRNSATISNSTGSHNDSSIVNIPVIAEPKEHNVVSSSALTVSTGNIANIGNMHDVNATNSAPIHEHDIIPILTSEAPSHLLLNADHGILHSDNNEIISREAYSDKNDGESKLSEPILY